MDLNNLRGIFVCSVLRNILMKLIYNTIYVNVDESMTDSQVGAQKKKCEESSVCIKFYHKQCHELCEKGGNSFKCDGLQTNV